MYEDLITQLTDLGVDFTENEDGTVSVSVGDMDKDTLISVIQAVNDNGFTFSINETDLTIDTGAVPAEEAEEELAYDEGAMDQALADYEQGL